MMMMVTKLILVTLKQQKKYNTFSSDVVKNHTVIKYENSTISNLRKKIIDRRFQPL